MSQVDRTSSIFRARVDSVGRVVIPAEVRHRFGVEQGDEVIVELDDRGIHITTATQALNDAQDYLASYVSPGESIADELIRERREEAARE